MAWFSKSSSKTRDPENIEPTISGYGARVATPMFSNRITITISMYVPNAAGTAN